MRPPWALHTDPELKESKNLNSESRRPHWSHSSLEQLPPEWLKVLRHCVWRVEDEECSGGVNSSPGVQRVKIGAETSPLQRYCRLDQIMFS